MKETDGYLIAAIVALAGSVAFLFKLLIDVMKESKAQSETVTKELTKNSIVIENNTKVIENNTKVTDRLMEMVNRAVKK